MIVIHIVTKNSSQMSFVENYYMIQAFPAIMAEHDEYIEHSKSGSGDGEKVYRRRAVCMIVEKSPPYIVKRASGKVCLPWMDGASSLTGAAWSPAV